MGALDRAIRLDREAEAMLATDGLSRELVTASEQAVAAYDAAVGKNDPRVLRAIQRLARIYMAVHLWHRAEAINQRWLAITEATSGTETLETVEALKAVAEVYWQLNDFSRARTTFERILHIRKKLLPPDSMNVAATLIDLASVYGELGEYTNAEQFALGAIDIYTKRKLPENDNHWTPALGSLGRVYLARARYQEAEQLFRRTLSIAEANGEDEDIAIQLSNLGGIARHQGDDVAAEPYHKRALALMEKLVGPHDLRLGSYLNNLGQLYYRRHDYARARPLLERRLDIMERMRDPRQHLDAHVVLGQLAMSERKHDEAAEQFKKALEAAERAQNLESQIPWCLALLASARLEQKQWESANELNDRALSLLEQSGRVNTPEYAVAIQLQAYMAHRSRDFSRAEALYKRLIDIVRSNYGERAHQTGAAIEDLAALEYLKGDLDAAADAAFKAGEIEEHNIAHTLVAGSEAQKRAYLNWLFDATNLHVSIALAAHRGGKAARLGATTVLRRKGRVIDALADNMAAARTRATSGQRKKLEALVALRTRLATETLAGPGGMSGAQYKSQLIELEHAVDELENELAASVGPSVKQPPVTVEAVQRNLPPDATLIEFVAYGSLRSIRTDVALRTADAQSPLSPAGVDVSQYGSTRYAAFVLHTDGEPIWIELGEVADIDKAITALQHALTNPTSDPRPVAHAAYTKIFEALEKALGGSNRVIIAPDGLLNLVPFGALVDRDSHYLMERMTITYAGSGRDLLRAKDARSLSSPVVIGDPAYDFAVAPPAGAMKREVAGTNFVRLPGARQEAWDIASLFGTRPLIDKMASEVAVKAVHAPTILHMATHAYFQRSGPTPTRVAPMLRAGLALAGANSAYEGGEDGILTALELMNLDLHGTKVVALSACDTANGDTSIGDGVYGLRRAITIAGAQTTIMSLWPIRDRVTQKLMVDYYRRLRDGEGRVEALRQAQLGLLHQRQTAHPYYWAAFIATGADSAMNGLPGKPPRLGPGPRGCGGCDLASSSPPTLVVLAIWLIISRRLHVRSCR